MGEEFMLKSSCKRSFIDQRRQTVDDLSSPKQMLSGQFAMDEDDFGLEMEKERPRPKDPQQIRARQKILDLFATNPEHVFYSRQVAVILETEFFHWVTTRALRDLAKDGAIASEVVPLPDVGRMNLYWSNRYRYPQRKKRRLIELVTAFSTNEFGALLGREGENQTLEAFSRSRFVQEGRNTREFAGKKWGSSGEDLDFIWSKDGQTYGLEVKNSLDYIDERLLKTKIAICAHLGIAPVFVVRAMPKPWIHQVNENDGFVLVLRYQLYPQSHREMARVVREEMMLPVDTPRCLADGTVERFTKWHEKRVNS